MTLIELVIVLVIVAVLAAVAYPSYVTQVQKTSRHETIGTIYDIAVRLEQYRTQKLRYPQGDDLKAFAMEESKYSIEVRASGTPGAGFVIVAAPVEGTSQAQDRCGTMTLNQQGEWSFSTGLSVDDCI